MRAREDRSEGMWSSENFRRRVSACCARQSSASFDDDQGPLVLSFEPTLIAERLIARLARLATKETCDR